MPRGWRRIWVGSVPVGHRQKQEAVALILTFHPFAFILFFPLFSGFGWFCRTDGFWFGRSSKGTTFGGAVDGGEGHVAALHDVALGQFLGEEFLYFVGHGRAGTGLDSAWLHPGDNMPLLCSLRMAAHYP